MQQANRPDTITKEAPANPDLCFHCGSVCMTETIGFEGRFFCCEGCRLVFELINNNGLCNYYELAEHPGLGQIKPVRADKFSYLDNKEIASKLLKFTDGNHAIVTFYLPGVHCSSCMWLLEHMYKLHSGITQSRLSFANKEVTIHFRPGQVSVRQIVELLATIGYEPHISLDETGQRQISKPAKGRIYKLGVAGFCFGNIMMLSFPEYLSGSSGMEHQYAQLFRWLNLVLAIPVFFFSSSEFFATAWAGLRQRILNIDAPIALAILITFGRSVFEILSNTGSGYLDSMSGIVFFMLVGRVVQERTYQSFSFHRDYRAYFPLAVTVIEGEKKESRHLQDLRQGDLVSLHNEEIIPADGTVVSGNARIDYSFVTGENEPVRVEPGQPVYAGGKQIGDQVTVRITKPVASSYLTSLWNDNAFSRDKARLNDRKSVLHQLSKHFTAILFGLALLTAAYWALKDPSYIIPSVTAMLIVACPCALLLSATFTNGNLLRLLSNNGLFLRDASVIEQLGRIDHIVFDKTGTLTEGSQVQSADGQTLTELESALIFSAAVSSSHPYSKALCQAIGSPTLLPVDSWREVPGSGIVAEIAGVPVAVGSKKHVDAPGNTDSEVYARIGDKIFAFAVAPRFRSSASSVLARLASSYGLSLVSGDNDLHAEQVQRLFQAESKLLFNQRPDDKLSYIRNQQASGARVMMIGDGLNDAGALQQSNVGVTVADDVNSFTPACDVILDARRLEKLPQLLSLARSGRRIINGSFVVSVLYNIIGLFIAVQGKMNPMIAAILMPASTLSIVLITTGASNLIAKMLGLSLRDR